MATPPPSPKILFLFLLSFLILCSTGVFIKNQNQEAAPMEEEEHQTFLSSRRQLIPNPILRFLDPTATAAPQVTVSPTPPLVTVPSSTPVPAAPSPPTTLPPPTLPPPTLPPPTPVTSNPPAAATPITSNPPASNGNGNPAVTPPAAAGQRWCIAKAGAPAASVQAALDYACGTGADCGAVQQGGACFNPNTLQNHASYAFSSFYQKQSGQSGSCNFNGVAETTYANPSPGGSCVYPTSSSSTSPTTAPPTPTTPNPTPPTTPTPPMTPTPATPTPMTPNPATPTTTTPPSSSGFAAPPNIFNGINPGSGSTGFGLNPPTTSSSSSTTISVSLQYTFISCIVLVTSIVKVLGI